MDKIKLIKKGRLDGKDYELLEANYNGIDVTFRHWLKSDLVEIKLDDAFAKCNGYQNLDDMFQREQIMKIQLLSANLGKLPEWIIADSGDRGFYVLNKKNLN